MKAKIIQALKQEYKTLGVSEGAFDGVASFLEKTITEEVAIAEAVKEPHVSALLRTIQGDVDRERGEKNRLRVELDELKVPKPKNNPEPKEDAAGELLAQIKEMRTELAGLKMERVHQTTVERIQNLLRENKVPDSFIGVAIMGRTFDDKFDVDAFVKETTESFSTLQTMLADDKFRGGKAPEDGDGSTDPVDTFIQTIEAGTKELKEKNK